ncbi:MAG: bifunctional 3-deoxy-7-phosphoheptulonate synthase/chorismate mutase type II [Bacteroidales bacterium]|nr:bifunctional 3-deoxy-7-phosphoheptulonate synthase/chorismate mutase type II [Bacteroidales bacterium]
MSKPFFTRPADGPLLVAGPCSVESHEQLLAAAKALAGKVRLVRCGVWKPRTRPSGFEGLGEPALRWIDELRRTLGVEFCCEVARPEQVELCLQYGVRAVWLGARTTANPFMVSELCAALRGSGLAVMVKNPVCPDAPLWLGAFERLAEAGISDLCAVHRGFSLYHNRGYRNTPLWEVALELRRERPDLPILCDPSHMAGQASMVPRLSRVAMQLCYDGLMVEVHPQPEAAWTDARQQLSPAQFEALLENLPRVGTPGGTPPEGLDSLRSQIDSIDHTLIAMLAERMECSRRIAEVKRREGLAVYQSARWDAVVADRLRHAAEMGLDEAFTKDLMEKIHAESVRVQLEQ